MKKHSAFSLIELSIVVLIIGVLIAGVTQSTRLVKQARLRTARALTQSSPVVSMTGMLVWYETSLESSFASTVQNDGDTVSTWYDNNPQSSSSQRLNATTGAGTATFYNSIFNGGIPAVRFGGSASLSINSALTAMMVGQPYTIFVVEQKRSTASTGYFLGSSGTACTTPSTTNPCFGYSADTTVNFGGNTVALSGSGVAVSSYTTPVTRIHAAMLDTIGVAVSGTAGKRYWLNGGAAAGDAYDTTTTTSYATLTALASPTLGLATAAYYVGDLAEVIIFNRALKTEERLAVEAYLGKKYGVTMAIS